MRILIAHNYYQQPGGEDAVFEAEARLLESRGHHVVRYAVHNDQVRAMNPLHVAARTLWSRQSRAALADLVRQERIDVAHFHNTFPLISPAAYAAARRAGAAVVQTLHNHRLVCPSGILCRDGHACLDCVGRRVAWPAVAHKCYRGSRAGSAVVALMQTAHRTLGTWRRDVDLYLAPSDSTRRTLCDAGAVPPDRVVIKPHFVDPDPGPGDGNGGYLVFLGRLSEEKGLRTLLRAWQSLPHAPRLKIIGDGPLASLVRDQPNVDWLGRMPMADAYRVVGGAAALVFPSEGYETFGRVIAEAYAVGTPVIASRLGTAVEMVHPGRTGELFEPGDALDLACRVNELCATPDRLRAMRPAARAEYEAKYHADANYEQLLAHYQSALDRRRRHGERRAPAAAGGMGDHELGRWEPARLPVG